MGRPNELANHLGMRMYQKVRVEYEELKSQFTNQRNHMVSLCKSYKTMCEFMRTVTNLGSTYLSKLQQITDQYQSEYILSHERRIKLELYEDFKGVTLLSEKDLQTMQEYINDFADAVKSEIDRRDLLNNGKDLPEDVIDGLIKLQDNDREDH